MNDREFLRIGGAAALIGGVLALVGNLLHPRLNANDVDNYRQVADSDRYVAADLVILVALLLIAAAFVAIARSLAPGRGGALADLGRIAAVSGAAIALAQTGIEICGFRQAARTFATAAGPDQVGAFWATNAIDQVNVALFGVWTAVFLGVAPLLLGAAALRQRRQPVWIAAAGVLGGACCVVVGFVNLVVEDQTTLESPFLVGSLLVTLWVLAEGYLLLRGDDRRDPVNG